MPTINGVEIGNGLRTTPELPYITDLENLEILYAGKILPLQATPVTAVPIDPNVQYNGLTLPAQKVQPVLYPKTFTDQTNNPSSIYFTVDNNTFIYLPASSQIIPKGKKILAESQIIDGVSVFEHISRKPYEIDIESTLWQTGWNVPFPQDQINFIWNNLWLPNTVFHVGNTFLNALGISQVIVESISPMPQLGSTKVVLKIKLFENQVGQTLIV